MCTIVFRFVSHVYSRCFFNLHALLYGDFFFNLFMANCISLINHVHVCTHTVKKKRI